MSTQTPLKIIGKEFLLDENLLVSNYNPFDSRNTAGISGLYNDSTLTGKLYIFNKKEYKEPTASEFKNIKAIAQLAAAPYKLITDATFNSLSISILSKYDQINKKRTFQLNKANSVLDIVPVLSNGIKAEDFIKDDTKGLLGSFAIFVVDYSAESTKLNKKVYTDLAAGEQYFMYLIPSDNLKVSEIQDTGFIGITFNHVDSTTKHITLENPSFSTVTIDSKSYLNNILKIPGDSKYTRTATFNSLEFSIAVGPVTGTDVLVLDDTLKTSIHDNIKQSLINDVVASTTEIFNFNPLTSPTVNFTLLNNQVYMNFIINNEVTTLVPATPTIDFKISKSFNLVVDTVTTALEVKFVTVKGGYLLPLKYNVLEYDINPASTTAFFELQQLGVNNRDGVVFSTGDPDYDLPNRKVYMYGGATDNSAAANNNLSNTLYRSNILNDGSLEGFTSIGTNTLGIYEGATYTYIKDIVNGTGWVYLFGGLAGASLSAITAIKRAPILTDGTIGLWEDVGNPLSWFRYQKVIGNPESKNIIYVYSSQQRFNGASSDIYMSIIYTYKIADNGSLSLIQTYTSTKNHYLNTSIILKDPILNKQFLYIFGTLGTDLDPSIYKYEISTDGTYKIIGSAIKVGDIDKPISHAQLLEDRDNVYLVGGLVNNTAYKIGARRNVLKYPKASLLAGSPTNLIQPISLTNLSYPISKYTDAIKTKYGYYAICPLTTTNETGTAYNWQSTGRIFGFKQNEISLLTSGKKLIMNEFNFGITSKKNDDSSLTKFLPNKTSQRLKEELFTNLFVKGSQTLEAYGETIKFIDPESLNSSSNLLNGVNKITVAVTGSTGILLRLFDKSDNRIIFNNSDFIVDRSKAVEWSISNDGIKYHSDWVLTNPKNSEMEATTSYLYGAYYAIQNGSVSYTLNTILDLSRIEFYDVNDMGISTSNYKIYLNDKLFYEKTSGFKTGRFVNANPNSIINYNVLENTSAVAISKREKIFLDWLKDLSTTTNLTEYNRYFYSAGLLNTLRKNDIIIPEIIFNLIVDKNMFNINLKILSEYLVTNPLSEAQQNELVGYGYSLQDFKLDEILYVMYKYKINTNTKTSLTYSTDGLVYPKYNTIGFGTKPINFSYIFLPQLHNKKVDDSSKLVPLPANSTYLNSGNLNGKYNLKIAEASLNYKSYEISMVTGFYFVSVNGSNSNSGLSPEKAKKDLTTIPAGSNVYLLPGTYTGSYTTIAGGGINLKRPLVLQGFNAHNIYGTGNNTIIDFSITGIVSSAYLNLLYNPTGGSIHNVKFLFGGLTGVSSDGDMYYTTYVLFDGNNNGSTGIYFYNCTFINTNYYNPGTPAYSYKYMAYYYNCTITGGIYRNGYYGNKWSAGTQARISRDDDLLTGKFSPDSLSVKNYVDNFVNSFSITPTYTLIPISDNSEGDGNSVVLENTSNITNILNLDYKL